VASFYASFSMLALFPMFYSIRPLTDGMAKVSLSATLAPVNRIAPTTVFGQILVA
jgi:hypothetical protein